MAAPNRIYLAGVHDPRGANAYTTLVTNGKGQRFVNWIPYRIINQIQNQATFKLEKRPGWAAQTVNASSGGTGMFGLWWWPGGLGLVVSFSGGTAQSYITRGTTVGAFSWTAFGAMSTGSNAEDRWFSETSVAGVANILCTVGSVGVFYNTVAANSWTALNDADITWGNIYGPVINMDGWNFILDVVQGRIYNSDNNSITSYGAANFLSPNIVPGGCRILGRLHGRVLCFKDNSVEQFYNAGNPMGSPLSAIKDETIPIGIYCYNPAGAGGSEMRVPFIEFDDQNIWVSRSDKGAIAVHQLSDRGVEKLSTPEVDRIINSIDTPKFKLTACHLFGRPLIFLIDIATDYTLVYNPTDKVWFEFAKGASAAAYWRFLAECRVSETGEGSPDQIFGGNAGNGTKIYRCSTENPVYQDDGNSYTATVTTSGIDWGTDFWKFIPEMRVVGDTEASTSNLGIAWSDDDYKTFTTARNVDMGLLTKRLNRCGRTRKRAFQLTHSVNTSSRIEALEFPFLSTGTL